MIIARGLCLDHSRQINHLPSGRGFGEGQAGEDRSPVGTMSTMLTRVGDTALTPNQKCRLVVKYGEEWRLVFGLAVGRDGSIYIRTCNTVSKARASTTPIATGATSVNINLADADAVDLTTLKDPMKTTVHSSGIVNYLGRRTSIESLRTLDRQMHVVLCRLRHPRHMDVVELSRRRREVDLCVPYEFDEERPWQLDLIVAPRRKLEYAGNPKAIYQILTVIHISKLKDCQDLSYQVLLSHDEPSVWLEGEVLMFIPPWASGGRRPVGPARLEAPRA